jgi:DNA topoisomerase 2-associated protein PAT1
VVLSNIRTPKMLMDVGGASSGPPAGAKGGAGAGHGGSGSGSGGSRAQQRPLEQEPMLAARIMVEDCMLLLCDVEDIDRTFAATAALAHAAGAGAGAPPAAPAPLSAAQAAHLLQRRGALLGGIAASFRLPDAPLADARDGGAPGGSDRVFVRVLALPKGRSLVAKTLRLMFTPPHAPGGASSRAGGGGSAGGSGGGGAGASAALGLDVIWALLRNARGTFGPALAAGAGGEAERRLTDATSVLAAAASEMIKRLAAPQEAVACLAACMAGLRSSADGDAAAPPAAAAANGAAGEAQQQSQLLSLFPAGRAAAGTSPEWLASVLGSLLLRASELGLGSFAAEAAAAPQRGLGDGVTAAAGAGAGTDAAGLASAPPAGVTPAGVTPALAAQWQGLVAQLAHAVALHLWQLVRAARGEAAAVAAAAGAPPGATQVLSRCLPRLACVPLMRVLMAHCEAEQAEQIKSYLSEIGGR